MLIYHELVLYGIMQGKGQLNVMLNARPVEEVMNDKNFPDSLKQQLKLVERIKQFAFDSLGINHSTNYSSVYDQHGEALLWVITACEPYSFKAREWTFPIIGSVSYKGFFNYEKGLAEAKLLRELGYDVDYSEVSAWSTLGWFNDPILSDMLDRTDGQMANLFIHELTHGTLFVKNNVQFNENLASFVGEKGALYFLKQMYGDSSTEYNDYLNRLYDHDLYTNYILGATENLAMLYRSIADSSEAYKKDLKSRTIHAIISGINMLAFRDQQRYSRIGKSILKQQNAYFFDYLRYDSQKKILEQEMNDRFHGDIKKYIQYLKGKYPDV